MQTLPPFVPISAKGPLGLAHLPRMWSKALLHAKGELAPDYQPGCYFDRTLMVGLGIDPQVALGFLFSELPSYAQFEDWVLAQVGGHLDADQIARVNRAILEHELGDEERTRFQSELGLPADSPVRRTADLEHLDDLVQFHRLLTSA